MRPPGTPRPADEPQRCHGPVYRHGQSWWLRLVGAHWYVQLGRRHGIPEGGPFSSSQVAMDWISEWHP